MFVAASFTILHNLVLPARRGLQDEIRCEMITKLHATDGDVAFPSTVMQFVLLGPFIVFMSLLYLVRGHACTASVVGHDLSVCCVDRVSDDVRFGVFLFNLFAPEPDDEVASFQLINVVSDP